MPCPLMTSSGEFLKSQIYICHPLQDYIGVLKFVCVLLLYCYIAIIYNIFI